MFTEIYIEALLVDEDLEIIDDSTGFDPYDSTKK